MLDTRHRHIARVGAQQFGMTVAAVEEVLADEEDVRHLEGGAELVLLAKQAPPPLPPAAPPAR